ncbi:hypothetical protein CPLU01_14424 [Colletotrichum plurivorum]|uniref:Uncharacterized protein n=1 Tax=Colletotrichum plurivorum TaxID=2175906 RepID=A0A8H6MZS5_9PEZI|nr:hypothetical protein CPLU01_14424 [Colletotrichum plurivorum]
MHFTTAAGFILAALAPLSSAAASCRNKGSTAFPVWEVEASGVDDVPGKCGGLWDNLKGFGACAISNPFCGRAASVGGNMLWRFGGSIYCDPGVVEAVWYRATKNNFGAISC